MEGLFDTINIVSVILFIVGMVLIAIELFIPGVGIFGGLGFVAIVLCVVFQAQTVLQGVVMFLVIAAIVAALALIVARSFRKGRLYKSGLVLKNKAAHDDGYVSNDDQTRLVGKTGVSTTPLRPAGTAEFDGERADVVTDGEFLPSGTPVVVVKAVGRRILVEKADNNPPQQSSASPGAPV